MPRLMYHIKTIYRCAGIFRKEKLGIPDLNSAHHGYVTVLCKNPGITQEELGKRLCFEKSNVTRHLAHLEKNGYIEKKQSETDKRAYLVYPTEKMYALLPLVKEAFGAWNDYVTEGLSEEEIETLGRILEKMAARASEYADLKIDRDYTEDVGDK